MIAGVGVVLVALVGIVRARRVAHQPGGARRPRPSRVTVEKRKATTFRPTRTYVGTIAAWIDARVGPQIVSAYVDTVLVRPGATSSSAARCWPRSTAATPRRRRKAIADAGARASRQRRRRSRTRPTRIEELQDGRLRLAERGRAAGGARAPASRREVESLAARRCRARARGRTTASCARRSPARSPSASSIPAPSCARARAVATWSIAARCASSPTRPRPTSTWSRRARRCKIAASGDRRES